MATSVELASENALCANLLFVVVTVVFLYRNDYLLFINENNLPLGKYCGQKTGYTFWVNEKYIGITFHSDYQKQQKGFVIRFEATTGKYQLHMLE